MNNDLVLEKMKQKRVRLAIILGLLSAIGPFSIDMYLPGLPALASDLHTNASLAQVSLTACLIGMALGQLLVGPLSDRFGRRVPLLIGMILYTIVSILCAVSNQIVWLILLRVVQGLSGAAGIVVSRAIVRDMYEGPELTKFFSNLMLVNGLGPILAPIIGGQVLRFTGWRSIFVILFCVGLLLLIACVTSVNETLGKEKRSEGGIKQVFLTFGRLLKQKQFVGLAISQGFTMAAMFAYISGSPFVLQNIYHVTPQIYSICFATNGIAIIIGSQVVGRLSGRIKEAVLLQTGLVIGFLAACGLLMTLALHGPLFTVLIALFLILLATGIINTSTFSLAMQNQSGSTAGSAAALLGLLPFLLGGLAAPLVGIGGSSTAIPMGIVILSCSLIANLFYLLLGKKG